MPMSEEKPIRVFVSYSHADQRWLDRLKVHLTPLRQNYEYEVDVWEDTRIKPGSKWRKEIKDAVDRANVAVLIISADFLASEFIRTNELPPLLKAAEEDGALILPIIASPSLFLRHPHLSQFQAINSPSQPLISARDGERELVFLKVAEVILERAESARKRIKVESIDAQRQENFLVHQIWSRLIKIGDWIFDESKARILGSGMQAYLLSRDEYGYTPFEIDTTLEFTNFEYPIKGRSLGMNAGILFGWNQEKQNPRYCNLLITGSEILLERVGFQGDTPGRDYEHITDAVPFKIEAATPVNFRVVVRNEEVNVFSGGRKLLSTKRPTGTVGRVGLRPWRSKIDCTGFTVASEN